MQTYTDEKAVVKRNMNKYEWNKELDSFLMQSVIRNYFNFQIVSMELNAESRNLGLDFGATNVFNHEKCRFRWSYLHLQRKMGKPIAYKSILTSASESENNKENSNTKNAKKKSSVEYPAKLLEEKKFTSLIEKQEPTSFEQIEADMWKSNIRKGPRKNTDYLDTSIEDFALNKSKGIQGNDITPSSFNIFRDSLRKASDKLTETLIANLPDMNLGEIGESESEAEDDVLPLDFRTALIEKENRIVIQAKPLVFKTQFDDDKPTKNGAGPSLDAYLEMVNKRAFKEEDGAIMLDLDINIKEIFEQIELPCNLVDRMNNSIYAPVRKIVVPDKKKAPKQPISNKTYDTDSGVEEEEKVSMPLQDKNFKKVMTAKFAQAQRAQTYSGVDPSDPLAFDRSLAEMGLDDVDQILNDDYKKKGIVEEVMAKNKKYAKEREAREAEFDMMNDLQQIAEEEAEEVPQEVTEDSDAAPVSSFADTLTTEEQIKKDEELKQKQFLKSVSQISSASETDEKLSDTESNKAKKFSGIAKIKSMQSGLDPIKEGSANSSKKKVRYFKGMLVMSDTEENVQKSPKKQNPQEDLVDPEASSSSRSSHGSADEDFNQQRNKIRAKIMGIQKKTESPSQPIAKRTGFTSDEESDKDEEEEIFQKRLAEEKRQQMIMIEKKKAEAQEAKKRRDQLQIQSEMINAEQEKKRKEKEELMAKLKKQDEERKRRKKDEKEQKEREARRIQAIKDEEKRMVEEDKEREDQEQKELQDKKAREKRMQQIAETRKEEQEQEIVGEESWKRNGKTDIPCLFDKKCSYMSQLFSIPVELESMIKTNKLEKRDQRYKSLMIPLGDHLTSGSMSELIEYFLLNSTLHKVCDNPNKSLAFTKESFPIKCIGIQMTVSMAPLNKPSLKEISPGQEAVRVLSLLFDTRDEPKNTNKFEDIVKAVKLSKVLKQDNIKVVQKNYPTFMKEIAKKYAKSGCVKDFPIKIKSYTAGLLEFEDENELSLQSSTATLSDLAFSVEYTRQDDEVPMSNKNPFELFRRQPTFYAFNQNKQNFTKWVPAKKSNGQSKIITKHKSFNFENVCIILKDLSFDPIVKCKAENSLAYLLKKASKEGLDVCGLRMVYMDAKQHDEYYKLFHEKIILNTWEKPVLAVMVRGIAASTKVETILGHFNPETARLTDQKSLRACFGRDPTENCAIQIFDKSKTMLSLKFWFGGRVEQDKFNMGSASIESAMKLNSSPLIASSKVEKQLLFLTPSVPSERLPAILQLLTNLGITVLDIQKIDFSQFQYMAGEIDKFKQESLSFVRGKQFKSEIGYVIKLARENLRAIFNAQKKMISIAFDGLLEEFTLENLMFMTNCQEEFKRVQFILRKGQFKPIISVNNETNVKRDANYDSEDPDLYSEIQLFNIDEKLNKKTIVKSIQAKIDIQKFESKFNINTCVCFIKVSTFKKQAIGDTLHAILNELDVELLGLRVINAQKDIYKTTASSEVQKIFKCIAYKFHELSSELKLRNQLIAFKTLVLVLRGQNLQGQIDKIYDCEKMKFKPEFSQAHGIDEMSYQGTPHTIFMMNNESKKPLIEFFMETQFVKLYTDMSQNYNHQNNSVEFYQNVIKNETENQIIDTGAYCKIKSDIQLLENCSKSCIAICVIKPNQPMLTILRALRSLANNLNPEGILPSDVNFVKIKDIQLLTNYSQPLIDHLITQDILNDEEISIRSKNKMRYQYQDLFEKQEPILQLCVEGINALTKLKAIIGLKDPRDKELQTLRNFYGVDRVDNAFYVSETVAEAYYDHKVLFQEEVVHQNEQWQVVPTKIEKITELTPVAQILKQNQNELALIIISPTLVSNHDFVFVIDEFNRSKFNIVALKKIRVDTDKLESLFKDLVPRTHNLEMLSNEFSRGDSVLLVLEKTRAIDEASELIGKFTIKIGLDWEKKKKKKNQGFQFASKFSAAGEENNMISEYGSYIFSFPNEELNKEKIAREFRSLPNTKNFKLERVV